MDSSSQRLKGSKYDDSPLCPWTFSKSESFKSLDDVEDSKQNQAEDNLDELIWNYEPEYETPVIPPQYTDNFECVNGNYKDFHSILNVLQKRNVSFRTDSKEYKENVKVQATDIKSISLICCRIISFKGLQNFPQLKNLFVSDGSLTELTWEEFEYSHCLQELTIVYSEIRQIEMLHFTRLSKLSLWGNKLEDLKFLGNGLPCLNELDIAQNRITTLLEENFFKCFNLKTLNLSGNPICTLSDIKGLKVCHSLENVFFNDVFHGCCPIVNICSYRPMIFSLLENIGCLDGLEITDEDREFAETCFNARCVRLQNSDIITNHESEGHNTMLERERTMNELKPLDIRLRQLLCLSVQFDRVIKTMNAIPSMSPYIPLMKKYSYKVENRITILRTVCNNIFKDAPRKMRISKWEKGVQLWLNYLDCDTYGGFVGERLYSSLWNSNVKHMNERSLKIANDFLNFIRTSSCHYSCPRKMKVNVESIFILKRCSVETGLKRIYFQSHNGLDEPEFVKPPTVSDNYNYHNHKWLQHPLTQNGNKLFYYGLHDCYNRDPISKVIPKTFRDSAWTPSLKYEFPDSIPGLQDMGLLLYMFLICPEYKRETPLEYLNRLLTGNSECYKSVLLTTCAWKAVNRKYNSEPFSVLIVVKVLKDFLIPIEGDKINDALHHDKLCQTYCLKQELTFTPAFITFMSFLPFEKKVVSESNDNDVTLKAKRCLQKTVVKLGNVMRNRRIRLSKGTMFLNKTDDNMISADITSMLTPTLSAKDALEKCTSSNENEISEYLQETILRNEDPSNSVLGGSNIGNFLGEHSLSRIVKLKLSCNHLTLLIGMSGMKQLHVLDISHNSMRDLGTLPVLLNLTQFKCQFNELKSFHHSLDIMSKNCPRLTTVELLPNPFSDIQDVGAIPAMVQKKIPRIGRVDGWILPFNNYFTVSKIRAPKILDCKFNMKTIHRYSKNS